jgi:hypothetical protein
MSDEEQDKKKIKRNGNIMSYPNIFKHRIGGIDGDD